MVAAIIAVHMRIALLVLALAFVGHTAHAQAPGATMSFDPQPRPVLSAEDRQILEDGEVSGGQWGGGVVASVAFGFGIGQAVQGRWHDTGWIFTLGESLSIVAIIAELPATFSDCFDCGTSHQRDQDRAADIMIGSLIVFAGLHIWEIGDAAIGPSEQNARYHAFRARHPEMYSVEPFAARASSGTGGVAGLTLRF
jgi:hypothetical protein